MGDVAYAELFTITKGVKDLEARLVRESGEDDSHVFQLVVGGKRRAQPRDDVLLEARDVAASRRASSSCYIIRTHV